MTFESRVREEWPDAADMVLKVVRGQVDLEDIPAVADWLRQCHNPPSRIEQRMCAIDSLIGGYGCEAIFGDDPRWPDMEYVNMGDTYTTTIVFDYLDNVFRVTTWGDWIERAERQGRTYN